MSNPESLAFPSPIGPLTLFAENGALIALETGRAATADEPGPLLTEAKHQLDAYFDGRRKTFDLPLSPAGTARQRQIWIAMREVGHGTTMTYGTLAQRLGSSARAIGAACAANPLPILIPCHRILGAGQAIAGYSFAEGPETKRHLLALEGVCLAEPRA